MKRGVAEFRREEVLARQRQECQDARMGNGKGGGKINDKWQWKASCLAAAGSYGRTRPRRRLHDDATRKIPNDDHQELEQEQEPGPGAGARSKGNRAAHKLKSATRAPEIEINKSVNDNEQQSPRLICGAIHSQKIRSS